MKRYLLGIAAAGLALFVNASDLHGQRAVSFGLAAGATVPLGDLSDAGAETGFNLMGTLDIGAPAMPVGFRVDAGWSQLGTDLDEDFRIIAVTGNVRYALSGVAAKPYLIGGLGFYNSEFGGEDSNDFGINGGVGIEFLLSGFNTFGEVRFHNIFGEDDSAQILPIMFGFKF